MFTSITRAPAPQWLEGVILPVVPEGCIGCTHRSDSSLPDALVIQLVLDESAYFTQRLFGVGYQVLKADFQVIVAQLVAVLSTLADHPLPIQPRHHRLRGTIPRQAADVAEFGSRKRHIATITNDVNDQRPGNGGLDA